MRNIKANIALGGEGSGKTVIRDNLIEHGKQEGIFVVEGEEELSIIENEISENNDGIVLLHSDGLIQENKI